MKCIVRGRANIAVVIPERRIEFDRANRLLLPYIYARSLCFKSIKDDTMDAELELSLALHTQFLDFFRCGKRVSELA